MLLTAIIVPGTTNPPDVFFQQTPTSGFPVLTLESLLILRGHKDDGTIANFSGGSVVYHDLTSQTDAGIGRIGHGEVPTYYLKYISDLGKSLQYA